jgi:uncharacterized phage-like protein YoqJ
MIVAGTGHRPDKLIRADIKPYTAAQHFMVVRLCEKYLSVMAATKCISGMALGFDQAFAQAAMNLKLPLIAAVPFRGQERIWRKESQFYWKYLIDYASLHGEVHYLAEHYSNQALMDRNRWMVDHCNVVLALCNNIGNSGTAKCINYANLKMKPVTNIWEDFLVFET